MSAVLAHEFEAAAAAPLSVSRLVDAYKSDPDSPYHKLRYKTRENYDGLLRRIERDYGVVDVRDIRARSVLHWHKTLTDDGHIAMAHSLVGMLRTLTTFGAIFLESADCRSLKVILHDMRFEMPKSRVERLTADQVVAVRTAAHAMGLHSLALAQAFQFECTLRQKDIIGEYVPLAEPGETDNLYGDEKWLRGLRWSEIDSDMILSHVTSKRQKLIEVDLKLAPMVLDELRLFFASPAGAAVGSRPATSPIIIYEGSGQPYAAHQFRRLWRKVADAAGIPKAVKNMDTRSGAISEATDSGADLESVRHAAAHSNTSMTAKYSRGSAAKIVEVMKKRTAHRNRTGEAQ